MIESSRSLLVLLATTFAVCADTNISYQIEEINKKLTYLQGRLDLFDYITEANVPVLLHRLEIDNLKCAGNITLQVNKGQQMVDTKQFAIESKLNALATTVTNFVAFINETMFKPLSSCTKAFAFSALNRGSGLYNIRLNGDLSPFTVYCMADPNGGLPWTIVQRRVDDSVNFRRKWSEYKRGFGDLEGNFFIGLEKLHELTSQGEPQELWVKLTDPDDITAHAYYDLFEIGSEAEEYALKELGKFSGDAGDSLTPQKGGNFSTIDRDNDSVVRMHCADYYSGAWWYIACHKSHLNGMYGSTAYGIGVNWDSFRGPRVSMKYAHMAIRPIRK